MNRTAPDMSCDVLFEPSEWKSVYRFVMKKPLPPQVPTLNEFMKRLASLGVDACHRDRPAILLARS